MGANQIAEIAPLVREVFAADPLEPWCATLEVPGRPDTWIQVTRTQLNFAWPYAEGPDTQQMQQLAALTTWQLSTWTAGRFATIDFECDDPSLIARIVDRVFERTCNIGDYAVGGTLEQI